MKDIRLLVVGGESGVARGWIDHFRDTGANVTVVGDGAGAVRRLPMIGPDLVIIDLELPGKLDGFDTCRAIRSVSPVPVVVVAATAGPYDEVVALAVGADHFVSADTVVEVVVARLRSIVRRVRGDVVAAFGAAGDEAASGRALPAVRSARPLSGSVVRRRRSSAEPGSPQLKLIGGAGPDVLDERIVDDELEIDLIAREARVAGVDVSLTRIEFDLLATLARHPRRVFTREQLMASAWDQPFDGSHVLDTHLSRLRGKILDAGGERIAHAVRGVGYRLRA